MPVSLRKIARTAARYVVAAAVLVAPAAGLAVVETATFTPTTKISDTWWLRNGVHGSLPETLSYDFGGPPGWSTGERVLDAVGSNLAVSAGFVLAWGTTRMLKAREKANDAKAAAGPDLG